MNIAQIEELIQVLEESDVSELAVRKGDWGVKIRKSQTLRHSDNRNRGVVQKKAKPTDKTLEKDSSSEMVIQAPMVGIFHSIEQGPKLGESISHGQVVGVIESMKLMNDVRSEVSGIVKEILVEDGTPVEYGQPVIKVVKG